MSGGANRRQNGKHKGGGFGERFVGIPHSAYSSPLFVALSPWSIKLLVDLGAQYNGRNNGDLAAAFTLMKPRGWNSETTLNKAKKQLLAAGFIIEMRKGKRPNTCSLFALAWRPLNPSPKHDFGPNGFQPYAYLGKQPLAVVVSSKNGGAVLTPNAGVCHAA